MIVLALVVGAVTAWYLGVRIGVAAAIVSAVALLVSMFVPGTALPVYVLLAMWLGGLWLVKSKLPGFLNPQAQKKGWEGELDRWKRRAQMLWKTRK